MTRTNGDPTEDRPRLDRSTLLVARVSRARGRSSLTPAGLADGPDVADAQGRIVTCELRAIGCPGNHRTRRTGIRAEIARRDDQLSERVLPLAGGIRGRAMTPRSGVRPYCGCPRRFHLRFRVPLRNRQRAPSGGGRRTPGEGDPIASSTLGVAVADACLIPSTDPGWACGVALAGTRASYMPPNRQNSHGWTLAASNGPSDARSRLLAVTSRVRSRSESAIRPRWA